jgi:long-chain acyl-CoA synthetase
MTAVPDDQLPLARLQHWERARANEIYLSQPMGGGRQRDYTWAQAVDEARRMAAYLRAQGWEPGSRIAILSKNCAHWLMSDFAIWMAGHVSVPIYPTLTAESVRQILDHSGARACFVGKLDDWPQMKPGIPAGVHCIAYPLSPPTDFPQWDDLIARTAPLAELPHRAADELATIIYTSGTTGMPKGVMHSFGNIGWAAQPMMKGFGANADDRMISYLPLAHVAERWVVEACSIALGFRVYFAESLDTFVADLKRARPTMFISVPRLWVKFQQGIFAKLPKAKLDLLFKIPVLGSLIKRRILRELGLDTVRFAGAGAAPLPVSVLSWYRELGLELLEGYGMTENFGVSHGSLPGRSRVGYVGHPWAGVECRIAEDGEVLVKSPSTMMGYYREPEKTREALTADGFLRTGDVGELDDDGRLRITGRAKEQFKTSKGKYVAPAPIENRLAAHSQIEACCVAGAGFGQPFALLMLPADVAARAQADVNVRESLSASFAELLEQVNAALDAHEQLDFLVVVREQWTVENGFLTPTLKIKRAQIEKAYGARFEDWVARRQAVVWAD